MVGWRPVAELGGAAQAGGREGNGSGFGQREGVEGLEVSPSGCGL